jgi:predicted Zn-dependent peptidase
LAIAWTGTPRRHAQPDFYALGLLGRLLFSGKSSRLYQALVKDSQIAISVEGGMGFPIADMEEYKEPSLFGGHIVHKATVAPDAVRQAVMNEIAKIVSEGVAGGELERVKTKLRSDTIVNGQTARGRAGRLLVAALLDGGPEAAEGELGRYLGVTPEQIQKAAERYLVEERSNVFEVTTAKPAEKEGAKP